MAKKRTAAQVERAIRVIEMAAQEGLFGKYGPIAAVAVGGVRMYLAARTPKEAAAATRMIRSAAPKTRKRSKRYRDAFDGRFAKAKTARKRPARHVLETV